MVNVLAKNTVAKAEGKLLINLKNPDDSFLLYKLYDTQVSITSIPIMVQECRWLRKTFLKNYWLKYMPVKVFSWLGLMTVIKFIKMMNE